MDCARFQELVTADPAAESAEAAAHEAHCSACAAYAARLRTLEARLLPALRFDVAAVRSAAARRGASGPSLLPPTARGGRAAPRAPWLAVAAALVGGIAVWVAMRAVPPADPGALAAAVLGHWPAEPQSWVVTGQPVPVEALAELAAPQARLDLGRLGLVTYVHLCWVHGRWTPHLVVQGEAGPVMLLLMPSERLDEAVPLELPGAGLRGMVLPLGGGSVAVLATDSEPLEPLRERVLTSIEWTT